MIVVYGKPVSDQNGEVMKNTDWNTCIGICYSSVSCIVGTYPFTDSEGSIQLAWNQGSDCVTFNYTSTGPFTQLTNGSIVAFKVNSLEDQCPNGTNPPTFNNQNATQWISTDSGGFSYDHALELCQNESATLAGISYQEDLNYMIGKIQELRYQVNNSNTYARIDGQRTGGCQSTPNRTACMTTSGFKWTDTTVKNFSFYNWVTSSAAQATSNDNCLVLVANGSNPIRADVRSCLMDSPLQPLIVMCSKPAWTDGT
uniref:CW domain-containing protein n=2 Tax=Caenorhabditis tropicalis TaxID=1561998 RepID=A0A1I7UDE8_9PELO